VSQPPTHVKVKAVWTGEKLKLVESGEAMTKQVKRLKLGDGESVILRVEREADAKKYHQLKWAYGYVFKQVSEHTGYPIPEVDAMFRGLFMPQDVETLSLMSEEQMREFNRQCEIYAAETIGVAITGPHEARHWAA